MRINERREPVHRIDFRRIVNVARTPVADYGSGGWGLSHATGASSSGRAAETPALRGFLLFPAEFEFTRAFVGPCRGRETMRSDTKRHKPVRGKAAAQTEIPVSHRAGRDTLQRLRSIRH